MSGNKKHKILQVKDESDKLVVNKGLLWNIPFRIAIVGCSGSGKTSLLVNLVCNPDFYGKDFSGDNIYIISGSLKNDIKVKKMIQYKKIPSANLFDRFNETRIQVLYDFLKDEFHKELMDEDKKVENRLIIFDDVSFSGSLKDKQHGVVSELVCNCRKMSISLIFTSQKYSQLSTTVRSNVSGGVFFNMSNKELDVIQEDFCYADSKKKFREEFRRVTKPKYGMFVVNFSNPRDKWFMDGFDEVIQNL